MFDVNKIRNDFPILDVKVGDKPLVYLDNAATTQKPKCVIDKEVEYYTGYNSNIHRGVHYLSQVATAEYEKARDVVRKFINAARAKEIVFTRGATESINLIAYSFAEPMLQAEDEILISEMEHHANIVPWQVVCQRTGAKLMVIPVDDSGEIDLANVAKLLNKRTKIVSITHLSNVLGTLVPVKEIVQMVRAYNPEIAVIIDAAQAIQHVPLDVQDMDCDFLVASGHKMYAPTGIGFLYCKERILKNMIPYQTGGDMILSVSFEKTLYNEIPHKFEAGTPNIAGAIGLGEALRYIDSIGLEDIGKYEKELLNYATERLLTIDGLRIVGTAKEKASVISFVFDDIHPHDIGTLLDTDGIAIRTGHHCSEPLIRRFGIPATSRISFAFYNTKTEIDICVASLEKIVRMFRR